MNRKTPVQRVSALVLLAALPALSGTIPILDLMVGDGKAAVEAQHHPGTHGFPHNHLLCIQHQASQWQPEFDIRMPSVVSWIGLPDLPGTQSPLPSSQISLPPARAPPPE